LLFIIFFFFNQSFDSGLNLFTPIIYILYSLFSLSRSISWVCSFSAAITNLPTVPRWISDLSYHSLTRRSNKLYFFSAICSWKLSMRLFYLSTVLSTSSTILNWLIRIDSLSNIVDRVVSLYSWNNVYLILYFRMHLSFRLLRRTSHKSIF
jgi:hypothetical protein